MLRFTGFSPGVYRWFKGLEADNSREYFTARRGFYEESVRGQMEALLTELSTRFGGEVKLFRQHRDVRFSRDKSPYKTNTYGVLLGAPSAPRGLYVSISADGLMAGSGYYGMARDQLERYRTAVADDRAGPELARQVDKAERAGLELWGTALVTAPRGYSADHPRIELLRRKNLTLGARIKAGRGVSRPDALRFVADTWHASAPVTAWLGEHVGPSTLPPPPRRGTR